MRRIRIYCLDGYNDFLTDGYSLYYTGHRLIPDGQKSETSLIMAKQYFKTEYI